MREAFTQGTPPVWKCTNRCVSRYSIPTTVSRPNPRFQPDTRASTHYMYCRLSPKSLTSRFGHSLHRQGNFQRLWSETLLIPISSSLLITPEPDHWYHLEAGRLSIQLSITARISGACREAGQLSSSTGGDRRWLRRNICPCLRPKLRHVSQWYLEIACLWVNMTVSRP